MQSFSPFALVHHICFHSLRPTGPRRFRLLWSVALMLGVCALPRPAHAGSYGMDAFPMRVAKHKRLDGLLREWPALLKLKTTISGSGGEALKAAGLVGYDDTNLYVAMDVKDLEFVRTARYSSNEDHAELLLAFPKGRGYTTYRIELFPGDPGKTAGAVKVNGQKVRSAKLVEAPAAKGGFTFEATIPWSVLPSSRTVRVGLHGVLRYSDVTKSGTKTVVATGRGMRGGDLPPLRLESETALMEALVFKRNLRVTPHQQVLGDVAGDARAEAVAVYGRYLTIVGPGFRSGQQFYFQDLAVDEAGDVKRLELVDLTGDGKDEVVIQKTISTGEGDRDLLQVWSVKKNEEPYLAFQHEVGVHVADGNIENRVEIRRGRHPLIVVSQGKSDDDVDPTAVKLPAEGTYPALMPWDGVKSRSYGFDNGKFVLKDEKGGPAKRAKGRAKRAHRGKSVGRAKGPARDQPPPPRPPTADELLDQVYAMYRKDRGVGRVKPRFDFVTDVAGDRTNERVLIHGKDIVAFGKKFKGGTSYVYLEIGVEKPEDVLGVSAIDLTGDGKAEVVVRGVIRAKASKNLGGQTIVRHGVFIYKIDEGGVHRIFAAETGRSLDKNAILGKLAFVPRPKGFEIVLSPGSAIGWSEKTYPFPPDRFPYGGLEPLLLPWTDMDNLEYYFDGSKFQKR